MYWYEGFKKGDKVKLIRNIRIGSEEGRMGIIQSGTPAIIKRRSIWSIFSLVPKYDIAYMDNQITVHWVPEYLIEPLEDQKQHSID